MIPPLPPAVRADLAHRIGAIRGAVAIVVRSDGTGAQVDIIPTDGAPKVDENSRFEIGGVSEAITGTLLADAVRRNEVALDEPLAKITMTSTTDLRPNGRVGEVTLRMLATHRAGLPRVPLREARQPYAGYDRGALLAAVSGAALTAPPGTTYLPSALDYALLGTLLADRAGTTFGTLARDRLFTPLQMKTARADDSADDALVRAYGIDGSVAAPWRWNAFVPEGGVRASALDLVRFANEQFADEYGPLARDARTAATPVADAVPGEGIGLGWLTDRATGIVYAGGYTYGTVAFVGVSGQRRESVVMLANVGLGFANGSLDDLGIRALTQ